MPRNKPNAAQATPSNELVIPDLRLIRLPEVKSRTGLSRSEIYRRIAAGTFPRALKLGERASAWNSREVDGWIFAKISGRTGRGAA